MHLKMLNAKLIRNIIGWGIALIIPVGFFAAFCIGVGVSAGQCDGMLNLALKDLLSSEEYVAMMIYYQCPEIPELAKLPIGQVEVILEILEKLYSNE